MIYLLEIGAFTGSAVETLRFASHTYITSPADAPANTTYGGRIMDAGMLRRSVSLRGEPGASVGFGLLNNADGALDALYGYGYGREFVLKEIAGTGAALASAGILARGIVEGVDSANPWTELRLRARDQLALLQQPLLTERYAGTTTAPEEGVEEPRAIRADGGLRWPSSRSINQTAGSVAQRLSQEAERCSMPWRSKPLVIGEAVITRPPPAAATKAPAFAAAHGRSRGS